MWIFLKEGDVIKEGDECAVYVGAFQNIVWKTVPKDWANSNPIVPKGYEDIRRELKGWDALEYVLKNEKEIEHLGCQIMSTKPLE